LLGMEWGKHLPNTVPQLHSIQFRLLVSWLKMIPNLSRRWSFCLLLTDGWSCNAQSVQSTLRMCNIAYGMLLPSEMYRCSLHTRTQKQCVLHPFLFHAT